MIEVKPLEAYDTAHENEDKSFYIQILAEADKSLEPFEFLSLPAELRDEIYYFVLSTRYGARERYRMTGVGVKEKGRMWSHTAILMVSEQVHREALSVLYEDHLIKVTISDCDGPRSHRVTAHCSTLRFEELQRSPRRFELIGTPKAWPHQLGRFRAVEIEVDLTSAALKIYRPWRGSVVPRHALAGVNHTLFSLASFRTASDKIKRIHVRLLPCKYALKSEVDIRKVLWQIAVLRTRSDITLSFTGVSKEVQEYLEAQAKTAKGLSVDYAASMRVLRQKIADLLEVLERGQDLHWGVDHKLSGLKQQLFCRLKRLDDALHERGMIGAGTVRQMDLLLGEARSFFNDAEVQAEAQKYIKCRNETKKAQKIFRGE